MLPGLKLVSHWTEPESLETVSEWDNVILSWAPERLVYHNIQYTYSTYCSTCIPWMISIALHMSHVHTPERPVYHNIHCSTYCTCWMYTMDDIHSSAHIHTPDMLVYHNMQYTYITYCSTCIPWMISIAMHMSHKHTYTRDCTWHMYIYKKRLNA